MIEFIALGLFVIALGVWLLYVRRSIPTALIYTLMGIIVAIGLLEMQARPKPISMEMFRSPEEADVLWYELHEGVDIMVLLDLGEPRLYVLPWSQKQAEELHKAGKEAGEDGGTLKMRLPFERSLEKDSPMFYALPQPMPPAKQ